MRKSLTLTPQQWQALEAIAASTESKATAGTTTGEPSWRALIRRIADKEITLDPAPAVSGIKGEMK